MFFLPIDLLLIINFGIQFYNDGFHILISGYFVLLIYVTFPPVFIFYYLYARILYFEVYQNVVNSLEMLMLISGYFKSILVLKGTRNGKDE